MNSRNVYSTFIVAGRSVQLHNGTIFKETLLKCLYSSVFLRNKVILGIFWRYHAQIRMLFRAWNCVCYIHAYIRTTHKMIFRHFYTSRKLSQLVICQGNERVTIPGVFEGILCITLFCQKLSSRPIKMHKTHTRVFVKVAVIIKSRLYQF